MTSFFMLPLLALGQEQAANAPAPDFFQVLPADPSLVQQIEAINLQFDQAFNKHDVKAVAALFTANATLVTRVGTFIGRDAIGKFYGDSFQRNNQSGRATKINYTYALGDDLCALEGWIETIWGTRHFGGFMINVFTRTGSTLGDSDICV